jgi:hypothetical protein
VLQSSSVLLGGLGAQASCESTGRIADRGPDSRFLLQRKCEQLCRRHHLSRGSLLAHELPARVSRYAPHCQRTCGPDKVVVGQACYDPCPAGTTGTPPNCFCPAGQDWDAGANACKERPKCTGGMVGTPPNCKCPGGKVLVGGNCVEEKCTGGRIRSGDQCVCEAGEFFYNGNCVVCPGNRFTKSNTCLLYVQCTWRGTAPACDGSCRPGETGHTRSKNGAGNLAPKLPGLDPRDFLAMSNFGESCWTGTKVLCCRGYNN